MGMRLDWEAEGERTRHTQEDPAAVAARRRARWRAIAFALIVLLLIGGAFGAVQLRLAAVEQAELAALRAVVAAEAAALRMGDRAAFLSLQRSATDEWIQWQSAAFDRYQAAFLTTDLQLTGAIRAVDVRDRTARVLLTERVSGMDVLRVWFYWRYDDGWFHVLPDYTFWGDPATLTGQRVTVQYRGLDADFAAALHPAAERWLAIGCATVGCDQLPMLTIAIVADDFVSTGWGEGQLLMVRSPLLEDYHPTAPLPIEQAATLAGLIADRLVNAAQPGDPTFPADAVFVRAAARSWLVSRMIDVPTTSYFIDTIARQYGDASIGTLLRGLPLTADLDAVPPLLGMSDLAVLNADWRDYLTWRLAGERIAIQNRDAVLLARYYDTGSPAVSVVAQARLQAGPPPEQIVVSMRQSIAEDGVPQVRTLVHEVGNPAAQTEVLFRLVDGLWRRAN